MKQTEKKEYTALEYISMNVKKNNIIYTSACIWDNTVDGPTCTENNKQISGADI